MKAIGKLVDLFDDVFDSGGLPLFRVCNLQLVTLFFSSTRYNHQDFKIYFLQHSEKLYCILQYYKKCLLSMDAVYTNYRLF